MMDIKETVFEMCNDDHPACFTSTENMWIKRIKKLADKYPDDVRIVDYRPGVNICVNLPKSWFKVSPPRILNLTEDQRDAARERIKNMREKKD